MPRAVAKTIKSGKHISTAPDSNRRFVANRMVGPSRGMVVKWIAGFVKAARCRHYIIGVGWYVTPPKGVSSVSEGLISILVNYSLNDTPLHMILKWDWKG
jgi:hypothetical protein